MEIILYLNQRMENYDSCEKMKINLKIILETKIVGFLFRLRICAMKLTR